MREMGAKGKEHMWSKDLNGLAKSSPVGRLDESLGKGVILPWKQWLGQAMHEPGVGCAVSSSPKSDIHLGGIDCIFLHNIQKKKNKIRATVRCVDASPTQNDHQRYNTQREKQLLGKWFNIGDRSKKPHHTVTYITKISLTVSTTRLCSQ